MPRRPKKKRIRAAEENEGKTKLPRFGLIMTCRRCLQDGHNKRTCKNEPAIKPPQTNVNRGFGVMVFEDSGNIYARMPSDKRVRQVSSLSEPKR
ncbi:hypothetical protein C2S52_020920 [Perilla frutescens var. hirtella]|nr:hypothetical protein C2S52_020920 [Perilla frutescens var. hirtella]